MSISKRSIQNHRNDTFRLKPDQKLDSPNDAVAFVKERGFIFFWPIKGIIFPSLWTAVAGNHQVAAAHDDPGHITWKWKDDALGKRIWYYGKVIRKRATMIDFEVAPYFYALSQNYGNPEEDVLIQYQEGHLTLEAKTIFKALLDHGPLDTIAIRRISQMTSKESNSRFERALSLLQSDFKILPVGISDSGAWRYAFIYDLTHRYYPEILGKARFIKENDARRKLTKLYFRSVGVAKEIDIKKLFGWNKDQVKQAVMNLVEEGVLCGDLEVESQPGKWLGLSYLS